MQKNIVFSLFLPVILLLFISLFFLPSLSANFNSSYSIIPFDTKYTNTTFLWPTPGYSTISSNFGYRKAPIYGASSYHGGIDIAAPENSSIISIDAGIVTFAGWYGANGYTVIISHNKGYSSIYSHVSPNFLVSVDTFVNKGQLIAKVGPKYITKKSYTAYTDKYGNYTNGATTRPSSTFCNN